MLGLLLLCGSSCFRLKCSEEWWFPHQEETRRKSLGMVLICVLRETVHRCLRNLFRVAGKKKRGVAFGWPEGCELSQLFTVSYRLDFCAMRPIPPHFSLLHLTSLKKYASSKAIFVCFVRNVKAERLWESILFSGKSKTKPREILLCLPVRCVGKLEQERQMSFDRARIL